MNADNSRSKNEPNETRRVATGVAVGCMITAAAAPL